MYVGTYEKAKRQAQGNANRSGLPWRVFSHGGGWHVERADLSSLEDAEMVYPNNEPDQLTEQTGMTYDERNNLG